MYTRQFRLQESGPVVQHSNHLVSFPEGGLGTRLAVIIVNSIMNVFSSAASWHVPTGREGHADDLCSVLYNLSSSLRIWSFGDIEGGGAQGCSSQDQEDRSLKIAAAKTDSSGVPSLRVHRHRLRLEGRPVMQLLILRI